MDTNKDKNNLFDFLILEEKKGIRVNQDTAIRIMEQENLHVSNIDIDLLLKQF
jgi:hypothetical protein